jgi:hypothetical protein
MPNAQALSQYKPDSQKNLRYFKGHQISTFLPFFHHLDADLLWSSSD